MAPKQEPPVYSRELARIGDFIIKEDVLRFRLRLEMAKYPEGYFKKQMDGMQQPEFKKMMDSVLEKMVADYLMLSYAQKKGIELPAKDINQSVENKKKQWNPKAFENFLSEKGISYSRWRELVEVELKVKLILKKVIANSADVSVSEVRKYYQKNRHDFAVPARVRIRQIVTDSLDKASELHGRLIKGANFAKLAINHSLSPDRARGGDLGYFSKGSFPKEFDEACFKLAKGEISPVVKSPYGYHIFKLLDRKPAGRKTFEEMAPKIHSLLFEERVKQRFETWMKQVKKEISVRLQSEVLENFIL